MPNHKLQYQQKEKILQNNSAKKVAEAEKTQGNLHDNPLLFPLRDSISPLDIPFTPQNIQFMQQTIGNQIVVQFIQAKLKFGQPGDKYEQEADWVADAVMRMPEPAIQRKPT